MEEKKMENCKYERLIDDYLLDRLNEREKHEFEKHFFNCSICSEELVLREKVFETIMERGKEIFRDIIIQTHTPRKAFSFRELAYFFRVKKWAFASIVLSLFIVGGGIYYYYKVSHPGFKVPSKEVLRTETFMVISPQGEIQKSPSIFLWQKVEGAEKYIFSIYDKNGIFIWKTKTKRNQIKLPEKIKKLLKRGNFYSWDVKAISSQNSILAQSRKAIFKVI
jgi:hypothetical protein